jgi:hypothetical protein
MSRTVKSIAYVHTADIDPTVVKSGATLEGLANICVAAAEKALEAPPKGYTPTQRNSLTDTFASMKVTHRSIRVLVALGDEKPESVDALVLARLQLEGLYTLCLLTEQPEHVDRFVKEAWIPNFPTPGGVIKELPPGPKRAMLERLYIEYQDLCAYAHGRPIAESNKTVFDVRSPLPDMFPIAEIHKTFQQRIEADCQVYSLMSIAQSAAELTTLYPNDVELTSAVTRAWNELHNAHMLANAVWNIRTKGLFGVVG